MKKHLKYIVVLFVFTMLLMNVVSADQSSTCFAIQKVEIEPMSQIEVPVSVSGNTGVASVSLLIEYDASVLKLVDVRDTGLFDGEMHTTKYQSPYKLTWNNDLATENCVSNGVVAYLIFESASRIQEEQYVEITEGQYEIRISTPKDGILDCYGNPVMCSFVNGSIFVEHQHQWSDWTKSGKSEHFRSCSCGKTEYETHEWDEGEITTKPTETKSGIRTFTCIKCKTTKNLIEAPTFKNGYLVSVNDSYAVFTGAAEYPSEVEVTIYAGERENYSFVGWYSDDIEIPERNNPTTSFVMPAHDVTVTATWTKDVSNKPVDPIKPTVPSTSYTCPYTDISNHWAKDIIQYIDKLGLIDGATATTFAPDKPMTREVFVTAVARLAGVKSDYIDWAIDIGLLKGYGNGEYGLKDTITREQMAVFFLRFLELTDVDYEDCKTVARYNFADHKQIADWARDAVYEMQALDLIHGKGDRMFDPKGLTTRAEGATVLYNMCKTVLKK